MRSLSLSSDPKYPSDSGLLSHHWPQPCILGSTHTPFAAEGGGIQPIPASRLVLPDRMVPIVASQDENLWFDSRYVLYLSQVFMAASEHGLRLASLNFTRDYMKGPSFFAGPPLQGKATNL